jgi:hypothetical protein
VHVAIANLQEDLAVLNPTKGRLEGLAAVVCPSAIDGVAIRSRRRRGLLTAGGGEKKANEGKDEKRFHDLASAGETGSFLNDAFTE